VRRVRPPNTTIAAIMPATTKSHSAIERLDATCRGVAGVDVQGSAMLMLRLIWGLFPLGKAGRCGTLAGALFPARRVGTAPYGQLVDWLVLTIVAPPKMTTIDW
jgi:hypothetical protein